MEIKGPHFQICPRVIREVVCGVFFFSFSSFFILLLLLRKNCSIHNQRPLLVSSVMFLRVLYLSIHPGITLLHNGLTQSSSLWSAITYNGKIHFMQLIILVKDTSVIIMRKDNMRCSYALINLL